MDIKWLEDFICLARTRSFSRAAEERNVTQPALSKRIRQLEDWFDVMLFDRGVTPLALTNDGKLLRETAEEVVRLLHEQRDRLAARRHIPPNTIRFASLPFLSTNFLPGWLRQLRERGVDISVYLRTQRFDDCVQSLSDCECDFLITFTHPRAPVLLDPHQYLSICIGRDRLVAASAPDAKGAPIYAFDSERVPVPYLAYSPQSFFGRLAQGAIDALGAQDKLTTVYECELADSVKAMALSGHGLALLPSCSVERELACGALVESAHIDADAFEIRLYRPKMRGRRDVERFWATLFEMELVR